MPALSWVLPLKNLNEPSFRPEDDTSPGQIVRRQLNCYLVAREDPYVVHTHLSGNMTKHYVTILQLHAERGVREIVNNLPLHLNDVFLRHALPFAPLPRYRRKTTTLEVRLLEQTFVLVRHDVRLNLRHEIHGHHHDDEQ